MTPNRPTEQLNEQHLTALIAEYGTGNAWVMYYDSFKWSAGGFLIAGVFIFWGALFAADSPTELFTPATLVVTAVTEPRWNLVDTAPHRRRRRRAQRRRHHPTPSPAGESRWSGGDVLPHDGSMSSFISHTTVDCHNAYELSEWWKQVLGYVDVEGDPNEAGDEECMIRDPESGHQLLFIEVADSDLPAKRIHFDLRHAMAGAMRRLSACAALAPERSPISAASTDPAPAGSSSPTRKATSCACFAPRRRCRPLRRERCSAVVNAQRLDAIDGCRSVHDLRHIGHRQRCLRHTATRGALASTRTPRRAARTGTHRTAGPSVPRLPQRTSSQARCRHVRFLRLTHRDTTSRRGLLP